MFLVLSTNLLILLDETQRWASEFELVRDGVLEGEAKGKGASLSFDALDEHVATVQPHDFADDVQADTQSANVVTLGIGGAVKTGE